MTTRVTLNTLTDGQMVVEKVSQADDKADRRAEARWLATVRTNGVVQLLGVTEAPFTITTAHAGTSTLRTDHLAPDVTAALLASLCRTLGDLHERDIAHGKLTLDHVIISPSGDAILCSPTGTATDPADDLNALGAMIGELIDAWHDNRTPIPSEPQWQSLGERLRSDSIETTARRSAAAFERLAPKPPSAERSPVLANKKPLGVAILGAALICLVATAAAIFVGSNPDVSTPPARVAVGQNLYSVGTEGDVVLALPDPCPGQPAAVLLDGDSVVWVFDSAQDGVAGRPLAQIPGATDLSTTTTDGCSQVWASGPAGQTLVIGS